MEALEIIRKDNGIDSYETFIQKNNSTLVVSENGLEVILYHMPKDLVGSFAPIDENITEAYSILSGKIKLIGQTEEQILETGDSFILKGNPSGIPFKILEDLSLVISTNSITYISHKEKNHKLSQIMNKLQAMDGDTKEHCERVKDLCMSMIRYLPFNYARTDELLFAARFHDCGKQNIPLEILIKPSKLDQKEYEIMKTHPLESYKIVKEYFGDDIANIVLQHHERIDGKGYPYGLNNQDICLEAKIISVADAFDAMITPRPYNKGTPIQEALDELFKNIGTQFDEQCVYALNKHIKSQTF